MASLVVIGGSRGLGAAVAKGLADPSVPNWVLSRSQPAYLTEDRFQHIRWIRADLNCPQEAAAEVGRAVGNSPIGTLIYNAGIWEKTPLTAVSAEQLESIVNVNLTSALVIIRTLMPNIRTSAGGTVVIIGSTCGLENEGAQVAGYVSTKFALRGLTHALRETLRKDWTRVVCISPGSMATDVEYEDGTEAALKQHNQRRIPVGDIVALIHCVVGLSVATCVKEIIVPATSDTDV